MDKIKAILKKTYLYQYKKCLDVYCEKYMRSVQANKRQAILKGIFTLKVIQKKGDGVEAKLKQIAKLLKKAAVDVTVEGGFVYFIDEQSIPFSEHRVIDNIPFDYSIFVDYSLDELKRGNIKNKVADDNRKLIAIVEAYIDRICSYISKNNVISEKEDLIKIFQGMKTRAACDLKDALQRILFWNQLLWQTGHTLNGLSRLDKILDRFDAEEETLKHFLLLLHKHYNFKSSAMLGDTGQIIILGGKESTGNYFSNDYTRLFIKVLIDLNIPDPKILLRVSKDMPDDLLDMAINCIATGCGSPLLSNDDVVIPALEKFGYATEDAHNYAVSACWEPLCIGNSLEQNNLFNIEFALVFTKMLDDARFVNCTSIEMLFDLYSYYLNQHIEKLCKKMDVIFWEEDPLVTLSMPCCIKTGKDVSEGGANYNNYGLLSVGLATAVDSFVNILQYVYEKQQYTLQQVKDVLKSDYQDNPEMKQLFSKNNNGFGTCSDSAIIITNRIVDCTKEKLELYRNRYGGNVKFGLSSPAYVNGGKYLGATADGRCTGQALSTHISKSGSNMITDIMLFAGRLSYEGNGSNGNVLDIIIQPNILRDRKFKQYIKTGIEIGFFQLQFNVLTYAQLIDAKNHPERYQDLIVRVWGFSAYFKDIPEEYQDALIERTRHGEFM